MEVKALVYDALVNQRNAMHAYTQVLLSSVESMEASDAQVGSLRTRLLDSVAQKREVLGEASSTELVQSDGGGECQSGLL